MYHFILLLHILGAVGMGFYLLLPFLFIPLNSLNGEAQAGYIYSLKTMGRAAMYLLIAQLLTGGYLLSGGNFSLWWIIVVLIFFFALGPLTGITGRQMKKALEQHEEGKSMDVQVAKMKTLSIMASVDLLIVLILMVYPQ